MREDIYPFAFIHISFVAHQYLVNIVRSMLLNVTNPIPDIWIKDDIRILAMYKRSKNSFHAHDKDMR
jgi:hypothetical protein